MNDSAMGTSTVRSSPVSDGRHELPRKLRMWPKKRVKTRLRILSLNVGTMTGKSRELAEMVDRRKGYSLCTRD